MTDAINPKHYQFPSGAQTIDITENLNGNGAQAAEYIIRSTRLDGNNKSGTVVGLIEDLNKARWFVDREIQRLGGPTNTEPETTLASNRPPRVWHYADDIPDGVMFTDCDGDMARKASSDRYIRFPGDFYTSAYLNNDDYAPYTEVL